MLNAHKSEQWVHSIKNKRKERMAIREGVEEAGDTGEGG